MQPFFYISPLGSECRFFFLASMKADASWGETLAGNKVFHIEIRYSDNLLIPLKPLFSSKILVHEFVLNGHYGSRNSIERDLVSLLQRPLLVPTFHF